MGSIKDRNGMDLTEAEDINKRWEEYIEELYKKELYNQDNHDGVITLLEPDILEYEVKWALRRFTANKASGGDAICSSVQFSSVPQSCPTLCNPMNRSTPGLPVHHQLPEFTQTHDHQVNDAIQPSHPLSSPSPPTPNPSQHQSLFQ